MRCAAPDNKVSQRSHYKPHYIFDMVCSAVRCDLVNKWAISVYYDLLPALLTPCLTFQFLSDKKVPRQQQWYVVLQVTYLLFIFSCQLQSYCKFALFFLCFETFFPPNKIGILMLSPQLHVFTGRHKLPRTVSFMCMHTENKSAGNIRIPIVLWNITIFTAEESLQSLVYFSDFTLMHLEDLMEKDSRNNILFHILLNDSTECVQLGSLTFTHGLLLDYFKSQTTDIAGTYLVVKG